MQIATPKTADGCSPTVTTRSYLVCATNLIDLSHYPMGGGNGNKASEMKIVINRLQGGVSKTIPAGYWHYGNNNILFRTDGFAANGVYGNKTD